MRKRRSLVVICAIWLFLTRCQASIVYCSEAASADTVKTFSLKDAIFLAMINNRSIQMQSEELEYAKANKLYANSLFLPRVSAIFGYTYYDTLLYSESFSGHRKDTRIFSGFKNDNLFSINAEEDFYNGGANIANLNQARLNLKIQEESLRASKLEIDFEVKRLFYGLLLAYETKRIARDLVDQAEEHYEKTKSMLDQGTASNFDVLQSKVQVSRLIPQLVSAENAIELIMAEFKKLLSLDMDVEVKIAGELKYKDVDIKEKEFLSEAYGKNPQMILKLLGVDMNRWGIEFARAGWLPSIVGNASYSYRSDDVGSMFTPRHESWNVGAKASIAIFDGFATKAKVDEAKARYNQANIQKDDLAEQLAVNIKNACLNLRKSKTIIEAEEDSLAEAKEALRLSKVRFENGIGINLDVLDSQVALAQVEQSLAQGIYDYIMAKSELDRALGREFSREAFYYED